MAVKWLERSDDVLFSQDLEILSTDAGELRMSVVHDLGQCTLLFRYALLMALRSEVFTGATECRGYLKSTGPSRSPRERQYPRQH